MILEGRRFIQKDGLKSGGIVDYWADIGPRSGLISGPKDLIKYAEICSNLMILEITYFAHFEVGLACCD